MLRRHKTIPIMLVLSACLSGFDGSVPTTAAPPFRPEQFFAGPTHGRGLLATRFKADRPFHVTGSGRVESDGTFVLDQTITYADGATDTRSFRIHRVNEHDYKGTLSGVSGPVSGRASGNTLHLTYTIRKPGITMDQWIYLQPDGRTALNRATVRILGVPVAHLSEIITRG